MMLRSFMRDARARVVISAILGLGLAVIFRSTCKGPQCRVIRSPPLQDIEQHFYRIGSDCYRYTPYVVPCHGGGGSASMPATGPDVAPPPNPPPLVEKTHRADTANVEPVAPILRHAEPTTSVASSSPAWWASA